MLIHTVPVRTRSWRAYGALTAVVSLLVTFAPAWSAGAERSAGQEIHTEHYDVHVERLNPDEVGRLLEAFHQQLTEAYGTAPQGRLRVEIYADQAAYEKALKGDVHEEVDSGGYYAPETKKAYLWVQPSEYYTRQLLLHECTHQFHFLAACGNKAPKAQWYVEGLAEYYGIHNWDGHTLKLGVAPEMTLEDYPERASTHFRDVFHHDLNAMVAGKVKTHWATSWALVHFLAHAHGEQFHALAKKLDGGAEPMEAWREVFGGEPSAMTEEFERWMTKIRQPWKIAFIAWQQQGERFEGKSDTTAVALLKDRPTDLRVEIERGDDEVMPGFVFGYRSKEDYYGLQMMPRGAVRIVQRRDGHWLPGTYLPVKLHGAINQLALRRKGDVWTLYANDTELATIEVEGAAGLYVQEGKALFRVIP